MAHLRAHFDFLGDADKAVEMDPRTLTEAMVATLAGAGVNRASLGVQDFSPQVQANIHRIQPFYVVDRAVKWLRRAGITAINFDLMYGLPHQHLQDVERTVTRALALQPDRVAVFGYAHVPWFKKHQEVITDRILPDTLERYASAQLAADIMRAHGYEEIGFDHMRGLALSDEDRFRRAAIEKVMTRLSLDLAEHCRAFGRKEDALDDALDKLRALAADGLVALDGRRLVVVEPQGRRFLRTVAASFDLHWKPQPARHSKAV